MEKNYFSGSVPDGIGKLQNLQELYLNENKFSGPTPSSQGNLTSLRKLFVSGTRFEGSIPPSLGNCQSLFALDLSNNNLTGTIYTWRDSRNFVPSTLFGNNSLTRSSPYKVGDLETYAPTFLQFYCFAVFFPSFSQLLHPIAHLKKKTDVDIFFLQPQEPTCWSIKKLVDLEGLADSSLGALRQGDARPSVRSGLTLGKEGLGSKWKLGGAGLGVRRGLALGEAALGLGEMWACAGAEWGRDAARA
ncbi:unnamed protein product [Prunus armeniaca]